MSDDSVVTEILRAAEEECRTFAARDIGRILNRVRLEAQMAEASYWYHSILRGHYDTEFHERMKELERKLEVHRERAKDRA